MICTVKIIMSRKLSFGFQVFIEKLLYSCPEIETIYMLIREKKGLSIRERIKRFVDDQVRTKFTRSILF